MNSTLVQTDSLTKRYGTFTALDDCSLSIQRGQVFGLLGPNGAGKSTLIRLLLGFTNPTSGSATINGLDCHGQRCAVHQYVSYLPGDARLFRMMRGKGVLKFFSDLREDASFEQALAIADLLELDLSRMVGFMSTGMRQKLALSIAMSSPVPLLILDEPTSNLDPTVRGEVLKLILEAKQHGRTIIFSSHVLSEIEEVCDRVAILRKGKLVHQQAMSELLSQHRINARLENDVPPLPENLKSSVTMRREDDRIQIEIPGDLPDLLPQVMNWLAEGQLKDMHVQPIGLRSVYDKFHHPPLVASTAGEVTR